jgi:hypothetical protein
MLRSFIESEWPKLGEFQLKTIKDKKLRVAAKAGCISTFHEAGSISQEASNSINSHELPREVLRL